MKQQQLQNPAPWINSRHNPEQYREQYTEPEIDDGAWDEILRLQNQADTAMSVAMFLGGLLVMILMVAYIMWTNHLIIH